MAIVIEKLDEDIQLPFDEIALKSGDPVLLSQYLLTLIKTLQELLSQIVVTANFGVDLADGDAIYYALKQADGTYPLGTWRRIQVGDNLEDQVLLDGDSVTGTWTQVQVRERPI